MEDRCDKCQFARESKFAPAWLECRRRSPVHSDKANRWPIVQPEDWCGEFEMSRRFPLTPEHIEAIRNSLRREPVAPCPLRP